MAIALGTSVHLLLLLFVSDAVWGQIRYSIPEELEIGTSVGNIAEALMIDIRELLARKLQLLRIDGKQYFEINSENGMILTNEKIDRELLCMETSICTISLDIAMENPFEVLLLEVEILDINDNSPIFLQSRLSVHVAESVPPGARFPLERAQDPDVGTNTVTAYHLSSNDHFSLKVETANDGSKTANLLLEKTLDREQKSSLELVLTAVDGGVPKRSATAQVMIYVMDANDNVPVFDQEVYRVNVLENVPKGTLVIKLYATDLDEGGNAAIKYSFGKHVSQTIRELFILEEETGEIRTRDFLDFERSDVYEIAVQAMDNAPHFAYAKVFVNIMDINDNAPEIKLTSVIKMIPENATRGTLVAVFTVSDRDSGENGHVQCQIGINVPFKLEMILQNNYKLLTTDLLDREKIASYNISVFAWDAGTPSLFSNKTIIVYVADINDNPPHFTQSSYNIYLTENNIPGSSVFTITALDPDLGKNGIISYSLLDNQMENEPTSGYFAIDSESGTITSLHSFDYEELKNIQINVQALDAGSPSLSSTATVHITILDQNDNPPHIIEPLLWNNSASLVKVPHSISPGYLVTKVIAKDADSGQNARLSYQMVEATDWDLFTVGLHSGEIRAGRRFTAPEAVMKRLVVAVKDNGQPSLTSTLTIFCSFLTNATDNISELKDHHKHAEYFSSINVYLIILFGSTTFIFLSIIILLIVIKCNQDRNSTHYHRSTMYCCCLRRNSDEELNRRAIQNKSFSYFGASQTPSASEPYRYTIRLSPESSKSEFLFVKSCHPSLTLSDINTNDNNRIK